MRLSEVPCSPSHSYLHIVVVSFGLMLASAIISFRFSMQLQFFLLFQCDGCQYAWQCPHIGFKGLFHIPYIPLYTLYTLYTLLKGEEEGKTASFFLTRLIAVHDYRYMYMLHVNTYMYRFTQNDLEKKYFPTYNTT